jgi:hypothetical protein
MDRIPTVTIPIKIVVESLEPDQDLEAAAVRYTTRKWFSLEDDERCQIVRQSAN